MSAHDLFVQMLARRSELRPEEERRLEAHLADCPECRARADAYARQTALLRTLPLAEPPPALRAAVLSQIRQPAAPRRFRLRPAFALGPLAAAAVVVLAVLALHAVPSSSNRSATGAQQPVRYGPATTAPRGNMSAPSKKGALKAFRHPARTSQSARHKSPAHSSGAGSGNLNGGAPVVAQAYPTPIPPASGASDSGLSTVALGAGPPSTTHARNRSADTPAPSGSSRKSAPTAPGSPSGSAPARPTSAPQPPTAVRPRPKPTSPVTLASPAPTAAPVYVPPTMGVPAAGTSTQPATPIPAAPTPAP